MLPLESSSEYIRLPNCICFSLLAQPIRLARSFDLDKAGSSILARMAMIAITTSNSIKVNAPTGSRRLRLLLIRLLSADQLVASAWQRGCWTLAGSFKQGTMRKACNNTLFWGQFRTANPALETSDANFMCQQCHGHETPGH